MAPVTPQQEQWLKQALFTPVQIAKIKLGTADAQTKAAATRVLQNKGSFLGGPTSQQTNKIGGGVSLTPAAKYPALQGNVFQNVPPDLMSNPKYKGPPVAYTGNTRNTGSSAGGYSGNTRNSGANRSAPLPPAKKPTGYPTTGNNSNYGQDAGTGRYDPTGDQRALPDIAPPPVLGAPDPFPNAPSYPDIQIPEIVDRSAELNQQARDAYSSAYAPLYQSLDIGKQNATDNQQRSDQVIKGLYEGLSNDFNAQGAAQSQQYKDSGAQSQAVAQALQDKIGNIYGGSNQQEAGFAASLGQQAAGAEAIQGNAGERQFQQAEAATSGANQQNFYNQGAANAQNYGSQMSGAASTEGASRRSDLVSQLNNVLSQYDQQKLGYKSEEAQGAIQQGNVLSQRDLQQQQDRINTILQETGITDARIAQQTSAALAAYEAKYGAQKDQYEAQRATYTDAVAQRQAQMAAVAAQQKAAADAAQQSIENQQAAAGLAIDAGKAGVGFDPNTLQVTPGAVNGGAANPLPGTPAFGDSATETQIASRAASMDQSRPGTDYTDLYKAIAFDPNFVLDANALYTFQQEAARRAQQNGMDPQVASANAQDYWVKILGRH